MYSSGPDTGHENSGVPGGSVLIPFRFVWPYGGGRVFLSGSFIGWAEHLRMSPIEGCPTVFQVVCKLPPGYHEYKFFVDGEWRHDERQPLVSGNYGVVNYIIIDRETDMVPTTVSPDPSGNMEVDDVLMHPDSGEVESHGDGIWLLSLNETFTQISEADLELSRRRISLFLSTHTAYELIPESDKIIVLDVNLPVKQAFHILYEHGIPVAPLWDYSKSELVGVLSALDFILILSELGTNGSNLTEEELETHTIAAWKDGKLQLNLNRQIDGNARPYPRHLVQVGPSDCLKEVALKILQNRVATVPIIYSTAQGASNQQLLLHLASLSEILKCICRQFRHSSSQLPILQQPVSSIRLGTWVPQVGESNGWPFQMLKPNASLSSALSLLVQAGVSSIPIVDDNYSLLDIYSRSDITALAKDKAYAQIHLDEISIHQALQLGQDANSSQGFKGQRCHMCLRSDPLHKVMERLANPGVRRLVIVEAGSKRVEGIISLSDVFRFLLGV